jgi:hypothetical protein
VLNEHWRAVQCLTFRLDQAVKIVIDEFRCGSRATVHPIAVHPKHRFLA